MRKSVVIAVSALLAASGMTAAPTSSADDSKPSRGEKVWVCKFVGKPGEERLKPGRNPVQVSANAGGSARSVVVGTGDVSPGREACERLIAPPVDETAQVTLRVPSIPENTPEGARLYVAGNFNGWNPGDPAYELTEKDGVWSVVIPEGTGQAEFKFTRGTWQTAEGGENGGFRDNRTFMFTDESQTLDLSILSWEDLAEGDRSTAASNVSVLAEEFYMPQLDRYRKIWLYLPPDYDTSTKSYPVIYMHDGQNVFDAETAFAGEWEVDETLNALFEQGDHGAIVVAVDNGGDQRLDEYSPWVNAEYGGGEGDAYVQFIAETLKPYIDENFRTLPGAEYTALIGSSMGGLISTYGALEQADMFGKIGAFSPSYWFALEDLNRYVAGSTADLSDTRIYFVASANESASMASNVYAMQTALEAKGLEPGNSVVKIDSYGGHNEAYWRGEFAAAYQWLFDDVELG